MINRFIKQSPLFFSKSYMLSLYEAIKILYSYHLRCQGWRNCQKHVKSLVGLVVDFHGSVAFPILPIDIENVSRLSKHTLSMILSYYPRKLTNNVSYLTNVHPEWLHWNLCIRRLFLSKVFTKDTLYIVCPFGEVVSFVSLQFDYTLTSLIFKLNVISGYNRPCYKQEILYFTCLSLWGRVMHMCISKLIIIGSDNGLLPGQHQAII